MENITENTNLQGQESQAEGAEKATYSEEQVMEMLQRETDRRVSAALKKQEQKFQRQMAEAEKLRNMDESSVVFTFCGNLFISSLKYFIL